MIRYALNSLNSLRIIKKKLSKSLKRLLIPVGHGTHHTIEFIQYCEDRGIIPCNVPPNLTHIL